VTPQDASKPDSSSRLPVPPPIPPRDGQPVAGRIGDPPPRSLPSLPPPPALSSAPDVWSLLVALRGRWVSAVVLSAILSTVAAAGMWFLLAPKATAFAKLQVAYDEPRIGEGKGTPNDFKTYLQTTVARIKSRPVIWAALKRDEVKRLNLESSDPDPVQTIEEDMDVEAKEPSEIVTITYKHSDPAVATTVVNAIKEAYLDEFVYRERNLRARRVSELEKAQGESAQQINNKKASLKKLAKTLGTTDPTEFKSMRQENLLNLREATQQQTGIQLKLVEARAQLAVFNARVKAMERSQAKGKRTRSGRPAATDKWSEEEIQDAIEDAVEKDGTASRLQSSLDNLEMELEKYAKKGFRRDHISVEWLREQAGPIKRKLAKRRSVIAARVRKVAARGLPPAAPGQPSSSPVQLGTSPEEIEVMRDQLTRQVTDLDKLDVKLGKRIAELTTLIARGPVQASTYDQLADEIKRDEKILEEIGFKLERERLELRAASRITKFQDAELMKKDTKKQLLATLVAPFAVLCSVCGGLALMEHRHRRVRSPSEISRGLGIRVVGAVPRMPHLERHLVGPAGESDLEGTPVMESIDAIRTRLLHEADVRSTRVVMVTSATAGEGKTTLASALASSLARAGRKTLLLDGDLRRPTVHELFEVSMQPGFSEVLLGEVEVSEAAIESPQENLYLLPAGHWDREVLLALSRDGLEGIFEKLAEEFDFIVVDSHPVLAATDALLLGRQSDAVVLSVLREVSQMPRVYAAHQQLTGLGIRVLGAVVNGTNPEEVFTSPAAAPAAA
jgi:capsular exopolysaccharide synthesis family protein